MAACGQIPLVPKDLRNSRYANVFEPSCRVFPLRMLRWKAPSLCFVSLRLNCLWWYSAHLYRIPSCLHAICTKSLRTFGPPLSGSVKSPASFSGLVRSCNRGVSATHSPEVVWYPGGSRLFVRQLSGCELFRSSLDPGTRNLRLLCGLSAFTQTGNSLKHMCVSQSVANCTSIWRHFKEYKEVSPARVTRRALILTSVPVPSSQVRMSGQPNFWSDIRV